MALDKCPGVRPIGVGKTLRRIAGKTVCTLTRCDLEDIYGTSQLCGGVCSGIKGAIHTVCDLFNEHQEEGWGVLLIDASNAFNNINRQAVLWNFRVLWPTCSLFLFNTYRAGPCSLLSMLMSYCIVEIRSLKGTHFPCIYMLWSLCL